MLKQIDKKDKNSESRSRIHRMYSKLKDTELIYPNLFEKDDDVKKILKNVIRKDAVIQDIMCCESIYKKNLGINYVFSKLKDGFSGYKVEYLAHLFNTVVAGDIVQEKMTHLQLEDGLTVIGKEILCEMINNQEVDKFLVDLYSGEYVEDVKEKCTFEYISKNKSKIKIDFLDRLFSDKGFRDQGAFCVLTKTIDELSSSYIMEAIKNYVDYLYLDIEPTSFDSLKTYYIKWISWSSEI